MAENPLDDDEESVVETELLTQVRTLNARVGALGEAMFSREDAKTARRRTIIGVLVMILVAQVISLFTFVTVASGCFIRSTPPKNGTVLRTACDLIPGYDSTEQKGQKNLKDFNTLIAQIPQNAADVARLKKENADLRRQMAAEQAEDRRLERHR